MKSILTGFILGCAAAISATDLVAADMHMPSFAGKIYDIIPGANAQQGDRSSRILFEKSGRAKFCFQHEPAAYDVPWTFDAQNMNIHWEAHDGRHFRISWTSSGSPPSLFGYSWEGTKEQETNTYNFTPQEKKTFSCN